MAHKSETDTITTQIEEPFETIDEFEGTFASIDQAETIQGPWATTTTPSPTRGFNCPLTRDRSNRHALHKPTRSRSGRRD